MNNQITKQIIVTGTVQGVFYRQSTLEKATELNISGTVKNTKDGKSVEILATGSAESLQALINWCRVGPAKAKVDNIDVTEQPLRVFEKFSIIR